MARATRSVPRSARNVASLSILKACLACNALFDIQEPQRAAVRDAGANCVESSSCAGAPAAEPDAASVCGDGKVEGTEQCDDSNTTAGDGCDAHCNIESGWGCGLGEPSECVAICGDGLLVGPEAKTGGCDDINSASGDGCDATCRVEDGYACTGEPSKCMRE